jgi:hypothetical protein
MKFVLSPTKPSDGLMARQPQKEARTRWSRWRLMNRMGYPVDEAQTLELAEPDGFFVACVVGA